MNSRIVVHRTPQPYPCIIQEGSTWEETMKTCPDFDKVPKGLRCSHWDFWDGCKIRRAIYWSLERQKNLAVTFVTGVEGARALKPPIFFTKRTWIKKSRFVKWFRTTICPVLPVFIIFTVCSITPIILFPNIPTNILLIYMILQFLLACGAITDYKQKAFMEKSCVEI